MFIKAKDGEIIKRMSLQSWQQVIDVNLTGTFLCAREAATKMIENDTQGVIINISSVSRAGNMGQTNYSATKAAVVAMTTGLAKELSRYGIRTGAIAPGFIGTEMVMSMKPEALEMMTAGIPAKRVGDPDEIAQAVAFILENDYFSGRVIEVDGALRM
jgi:3-oxoacyl-[acyl-carrier protein] reductase